MYTSAKLRGRLKARMQYAHIRIDMHTSPVSLTYQAVLLHHAQLAHDVERRLEQAVVHLVQGPAAAVFNRQNPKEGAIRLHFREHCFEGGHPTKVIWRGRFPRLLEPLHGCFLAETTRLNQEKGGGGGGGADGIQCKLLSNQRVKSEDRLAKNIVAEIVLLCVLCTIYTS